MVLAAFHWEEERITLFALVVFFIVINAAVVGSGWFGSVCYVTSKGTVLSTQLGSCNCPVMSEWLF